MRLTTSLCAAAVTLTLVGCAGGSNPRVDAKVEEQTIRALDEQWQAASQKHDVEAAIAFYAPGGTAVWPDAPAAQGEQALRAAWTAMFKDPSLKLSFHPETYTFSDAGDLAIEYGTDDVEFDTPQGHVKDTVKGLVIWKKIDGKWKVLYDTFNSNHPAESAAAASAPAASPKSSKK